MTSIPPAPDSPSSEGTAHAIGVLAANGATDSALLLLKETMRRAPGRALAEAGLRLSLREGDFETSRQCLDWLQDKVGPSEGRALKRWEDDLALWQRAAEAMPAPTALPMAYEPKPNRLCYVLHNALPISTGGYATRGHGMALGLAKAGWDVQCVTRPGYPMDITDIPGATVADRESIDTIPYHRIKTPERSGMPVWDYILAAADQQTDLFRTLRPELVLAASDFTTALPALFAARRCGLPFAYEVRGLWEITEISHDPLLEASDHFHHRVRMETLAATSADHVFTLTGPLKQELIQRGVEPRRISLAPNSCNPEQFCPAPRNPELAARYNIPHDVPVIGYVGSFVQYEGLELLIQACSVLRAKGESFRLLLVGDEHASGGGSGALTQELESLIRDGKLQGMTILTGRIPHDQVAAHYSLIDIAPFPRKPQPVTELVSPLKPLEALAMEKAVIVSSVQAMTELVTHERTGLVFRKGDLGDLTLMLGRLIADPALRQRLGQDGRNWVTAHRDWTQTAESVAQQLFAL